MEVTGAEGGAWGAVNNGSIGHRQFGSLDMLIFITVVLSRAPGWIVLSWWRRGTWIDHEASRCSNSSECLAVALFPFEIE